MSARIEGGRAQLLTRAGLDWSDKYPSVIAVLASVRAKSAYLDGELCGVEDDGLPSFAQTQAASAEFGSSTTLSTFCISTARHRQSAADRPQGASGAFDRRHSRPS